MEQCLCSVFKAIQNVNAEVWVVDNASVDGSLEYLQPLFPQVNFLANKKNEGFARANNRALKLCRGKYVLFLNPDTILPEDCFTRCLCFMETNSDVGALGIRMVDGSGTFLPESKRSFPGPLTSFYKLMGLSKLFPESKIFAKYSLAYLNRYGNYEVDVLAGAFMLCLRSLVVKLNGFDESFFMYGEDIDLSFRIQQAGYKNYYFGEGNIIHFKGESTRKGSLNYVKMFYNAMSIFVEKHYKGPSAKILVFFLKVAIWLRAALSAILHFIARVGMPLTDAIIIFCSFKVVELTWIAYVRDGQGFIENLINISLPGFTLLFLLAATLAGIYDNKYRPLKAVYSATVATVVMLAAYSLLPEKYRFSRGVILISGLVATLFITLVRSLLLKFHVVEDEEESKKQKQTAIVGSEEEFSEVRALYKKAGIVSRIMGRIAVHGKTKKVLGTVEELNVLVNNIHIKELVFCAGYLSNATVIELIQKLPVKLFIRFHQKGSKSIVGSDSKDTSGEAVSAFGGFRINELYQKRMKRITDVFVSVFIIITFPIHILVAGYRIVINSINVLFGKKTWVGYNSYNSSLPGINDSILNVGDFNGKNRKTVNAENTFKINYWYAKNYDWRHDVRIIIKNYKKLAS